MFSKKRTAQYSVEDENRISGTRSCSSSNDSNRQDGDGLSAHSNHSFLSESPRDGRRRSNVKGSNINNNNNIPGTSGESPPTAPPPAALRYGGMGSSGGIYNNNADTSNRLSIVRNGESPVNVGRDDRTRVDAAALFSPKRHTSAASSLSHTRTQKNNFGLSSSMMRKADVKQMIRDKYAAPSLSPSSSPPSSISSNNSGSVRTDRIASAHAKEEVRQQQQQQQRNHSVDSRVAYRRHSNHTGGAVVGTTPRRAAEVAAVLSSSPSLSRVPRSLLVAEGNACEDSRRAVSLFNAPPIMSISTVEAEAMMVSYLEKRRRTSGQRHPAQSDAPYTQQEDVDDSMDRKVRALQQEVIALRRALIDASGCSSKNNASSSRRPTVHHGDVDTALQGLPAAPIPYSCQTPLSPMTGSLSVWAPHAVKDKKKKKPKDGSRRDSIDSLHKGSFVNAFVVLGTEYLALFNSAEEYRACHDAAAGRGGRDSNGDSGGGGSLPRWIPLDRFSFFIPDVVATRCGSDANSPQNASLRLLQTSVAAYCKALSGAYFYFGFMTASSSPLFSSSSVVIFRTPSRATHREWAHVLSQRFNGGLYNTIFPLHGVTFGQRCRQTQTGVCGTVDSCNNNNNNNNNNNVKGIHQHQVVAADTGVSNRPVSQKQKVVDAATSPSPLERITRETQTLPLGETANRGSLGMHDEPNTTAEAAAAASALLRGFQAEKEAMASRLREVEDHNKVLTQKLSASEEQLHSTRAQHVDRIKKLERQLCEAQKQQREAQSLWLSERSSLMKRVSDMELHLKNNNNKNNNNTVAAQSYSLSKKRPTTTTVVSDDSNKEEEVKALAQKAVRDLGVLHDGMLRMVAQYLRDLDSVPLIDGGSPSRSQESAHLVEKKKTNGNFAEHNSSNFNSDNKDGVAALVLSYTDGMEARLTIDERVGKLLRSGPTECRRGRQWFFLHHQTGTVLQLQLTLEAVDAAAENNNNNNNNNNNRNGSIAEDYDYLLARACWMEKELEATPRRLRHAHLPCSEDDDNNHHSGYHNNHHHHGSHSNHVSYTRRCRSCGTAKKSQTYTVSEVSPYSRRQVGQHDDQEYALL